MNSALFEGEVTSDGGFILTARGVCWGTSENPTVSNNNIINGAEPGIFLCDITGLIANTTYYVRAYATNSAGTGYGNSISFTTLPMSGLTVQISVIH